MAAPAVPEAPIENIPEFIRDIFYPTALSSFRDSMPTGELEIHVHRNREEATRFRLINMFPFMTLKDIKLALYLEMNREAIAVPEYIYLCLHGPEPGKNYLGGQTSPLDFSWNFPSSSSNPFRINPPFKVVSGESNLDDRFVDSGGERRLVSPVDRERITIEDAFFKRGISKGIPVIHAYLYTDLLTTLAGTPAGNPPSEREWNGRLYPMFPHLSVSDGPTPLDAAKTTADRLAMVFLRRQQFLVRLESILEREVPLITLNMAGIKYLQLTWEKKQAFQGIETYFYEAAVTERRPFIRLIATEGTGISKVFLPDGKSPDIQDPKLLIQWAQDRSPTPDQDFVFGKIMLRKGLANVAPIYATLRLFNDGTADCVVEPPKGTKKLEPRNDLESFGEHLVEGLQQLPYINTMPQLGKGIFVLGLRLNKRDEAIITQRILRERLPIFSSMFQEILPLPGEKPMAMLRFKLVSNFAREDRIQTFLTQVINRKVLRGEGGVTDLVNLVADEFQIDESEARKQVAMKLQNQGEVAMVVPETKEFMRQNNPGIDIAIFAQHPFYTFHLYNVNSLENLQRIVTALSILMSADSADLQVSTKSVKELATAEGVAPVAQPTEVQPEVVEALPTETEDAEDVGGADDMPDYLDFFAYEKDDTEMTLEEQHQKEVAEAARAEPPAMADLAEQAVPIQTTQGLRKTLQALNPSEELAEMPIAKTQANPPPESNDEREDTAETGLAQYFLSKLKEADSRLFDYAKSNPSLKRYVSQCQPTDGRQPAVLSQDKFLEMQEEYAKDNVTFQIYPLQPGEPKPTGMPERDYYTVLKYGSSAQRQNYYLCCRFFCIRDEILVREVDLQGTKMRRPTKRSDGSLDDTKRPGECPFCRGKIIKNQRVAGPNETILERIIKKRSNDKRHLFIGFLKKTPHPEGFYLPCCFINDVPIKYKDNPAFDKYKEWGVTPKEPEVDLDSDEEEEIVITGSRGILDYSTTLSQVAKKYIIGAEKLPLDVSPFAGGKVGEAQIGLLPDVLNPFFDQEPTQLVSRAFNPQKIIPDGMGFLRIGVENRHRFQNDSLLAAVAPFYGKNSADQMKRLIIESIAPREFLALNYGNLAIEFYDPGDSAVRRPREEVLRLWASKYLQVDVHQENEEAVMRAYMSYHNFHEWLLSDKTKKEYRQFSLLFSQSNILRKDGEYHSGITFIVLDILKDNSISVRCSPYGFNAEIMSRNDVAFILHHWSGIWEPIFYADNRSPDARVDMYTLIFQYAGRASWPPIVQQRLSEYMTQCSSPGRSIYTSHAGIHSLAMIPASAAKAMLLRDPQIIFDGILRDAYNHVGALLFREKGHDEIIALPVIDDGELIIGKNMIMDWEDPAYSPPPIDRLLRFYNKYVKTRFAQYPGFSPTYIIKSDRTGNIEAIQLRNGLYVPAGPPSSEEAAKQLEGSPTRNVTEIEWSKNHEICLEEGETELPNEKNRMEIAEFQEIFEHLRLTFANWLASKEGGGEIRQRIEGVVFSHKLPLFEKRKRMEILLSREVEKWITTDFSPEDEKDISLLRVNCAVRGKEECSGRCTWKQGEEKCLLHVPKDTQLGDAERRVSAPRVLLLRLIEELLRYGERRAQLFDNNVSRLATLEKPVVISVPDSVAKQVIYPEKSSAWYDLLRLEWSKVANEEPRFLEEMSKEPSAAPLAEQTEESVLPERLITLLGPQDPKTGALRLLGGTLEDLLSILNADSEAIGVTAETEIFSDDILRRIVKDTGVKVVQIDLRPNPPVVMARGTMRTTHSVDMVPIFVLTEDGPAMLVLDPAEPLPLTKADIPGGFMATIEKLVAQSRPVIGTKAPKARLNAAPARPVAAPPPSP